MWVYAVKDDMVRRRFGRIVMLSSVAALRPRARPEEIAEAACFFLSDRSSFMLGQTIAVSGSRIMLP